MGFASDMSQRLLFSLFALLFAVTANAEMYRWVDKQGNVHYTDTPPPPNEVKKVEEKKFSGNVVQGDQTPYSTVQAAKNFPVTLFNGDCGEQCVAARAFLTKRGVPFSEKFPAKNPADDEALKNVSNERVIPVLAVGRTVLKGFTEPEWSASLDLAGYPKNGAFPASSKPEAGSSKPY